MTDQPRDHVIRARLPWREDDYTECGRAANDVATHITVGELAARIKKWGQQRTAFTVCITCYNTSAYQSRWETDPVAVICREAQRSRDHDGSKGRFATELRAIEALIEAHRDEFDGYIAGVAETTNLAERRRLKPPQPSVWPRPIGGS